MVRLFASYRIFHVIGLAPWVESACTPSVTADAVCLPQGGGVAARFGGDSGSIVGQSYDRGVHRLR